MELQDWLAPTKKITAYNYEGLEAVIELLKQYNEDISKLPRGLVTTLRVLVHLAIPPENPFQEGKRFVIFALLNRSAHFTSRFT